MTYICIKKLRRYLILVDTFVCLTKCFIKYCNLTIIINKQKLKSMLIITIVIVIQILELIIMF